MDWRFEFIKAVQIQVDIFWILTPFSVAVGYQGFGGPCCLHLQGILPHCNTVSQPKRH
jgi:hypothetical protein